MFSEILQHRFWTLVVLVIALGGIASALFQLNDVGTLRFSFTSSAYAEETLPTMRIRVEVPEATFADEWIELSDESCVIQDTYGNDHEVAGDMAICAFDAAARADEFSYDIVFYGLKGLITRIEKDGVEAVSRIWFLKNNEFPTRRDCHPLLGVSITTCPLEGGETILAFSADNSTDIPLDLELEHPDALINEPASAVVTNIRTGETVEGAQVSIGDDVAITDEDGRVHFVSEDAESFELVAEKSDYIRSPRRVQTITGIEASRVAIDDEYTGQTEVYDVTTTLLDEVFLDHPTIAGALTIHCIEHGLGCTVTDAGELFGFYDDKPWTLIHRGEEADDLFAPVSTGDTLVFRDDTPQQPSPDPDPDTEDTSDKDPDPEPEHNTPPANDLPDDSENDEQNPEPDETPPADERDESRPDPSDESASVPEEPIAENEVDEPDESRAEKERDDGDENMIVVSTKEQETNTAAMLTNDRDSSIARQIGYGAVVENDEEDDAIEEGNVEHTEEEAQTPVVRGATTKEDPPAGLSPVVIAEIQFMVSLIIAAFALVRLSRFAAVRDESVLNPSK